MSGHSVVGKNVHWSSRFDSEGGPTASACPASLAANETLDVCGDEWLLDEDSELNTGAVGPLGPFRRGTEVYWQLRNTS